MINVNILQKSARMPVLFMGHGSPMNVLPGNPFYQAWQSLGAQFGQTWPRPQLILCISAHWLTQGWQLTAMDQPKTIHDFGGFPPVLYGQQYPAPGWPAAAVALAEQLRQPSSGLPVQVDAQDWELDHGAWGVLKPVFPLADIPVIQLSLAQGRPATEHFSLGQQLSGLREQGVLIVASGNIVHNLRALRMDAADGQALTGRRNLTRPLPGRLNPVTWGRCRISRNCPPVRWHTPAPNIFYLCFMRQGPCMRMNRCSFSMPVFRRRRFQCAR
jgi:4,5-DOPA dioxygenase extradiol